MIRSYYVGTRSLHCRSWIEIWYLRLFHCKLRNFNYLELLRPLTVCFPLACLPSPTPLVARLLLTPGLPFVDIFEIKPNTRGDLVLFQIHPASVLSAPPVARLLLTPGLLFVDIFEIKPNTQGDFFFFQIHPASMSSAPPSDFCATSSSAFCDVHSSPTTLG